MNWSEKIFAYCERAGNPAFWAEPFNAISNAAFLLAAIAAAILLARSPDAGSRRLEWGLILLTGIIGIGSFLFHTYATRWAMVADVAPIGFFMICILAYALRRFLGAPYWAVLLAMALFIAALRYAGSITCAPELLPITVAAQRPCFNGSLGYVAALGALSLVGLILAFRGHKAAWAVLAGASIFALSLTLRTVDFEVCGTASFMGRARGTHALWHVLNALLLYVLLAAGIRHGARAR